MPGIATLRGMTTKAARSKLKSAGTDSADALLIELVKFLARRAAERDDALSRKSERTVRHPGGKRDSK